MAEIKELREKMANIATEARSKLSEVTDTTPEARASEVEREFDAMMADHDKLAAKVERLEKVEAALRAGEAVDLSRRPVGQAGSAAAVDAGFQMDYRSAFAEMIANGGEGYVDQEVRSVLKEYRVRLVAPILLAVSPFQLNWRPSSKRQ
jgi:HK97 family phage major capsid protein